MITKRWFLVGASVITICGALANVSRADFLTITVTGPDGSQPVTNLGVGPALGSVSFTGVSGTVQANVLYTPSLSELSTNELQLTNTSNATETVTVLTSDPGFSLPGSSSTLQSTLSVSSLTSGDSITSSSTVAGVTTNTVTVNAPSGTSVSSSFPISASGLVAASNITTLTLEAGSSATLSVSTDVSAVPEPATTTAMLGMAGLAGLGLIWQRRKPRAA